MLDGLEGADGHCEPDLFDGRVERGEADAEACAAVASWPDRRTAPPPRPV
ncbi:hypothetical protein ACFXAZ_01630 [Streptomyces sp. NPDC059477]